MPVCRRFPLLAALLVAVSAAPSFASAQSYRNDYAFRIGGLPVGTASLEADFADDRYTVAFSAQSNGFARLFSQTEAAARAEGLIQAESLLPAAYGHDWREDDDSESVTMAFADGDVADVTLEPKPRKPRRYVPVKATHKSDVLDPISALVWRTPDGLTPEICDRTLAIFDGRRRFDLVLTYSRSETFTAGDHSGRAIVCAVRYRPVSGHRRNRKSVAAMAANDEMELWMGQVSDGTHAMPLKARIHTKLGMLVAEATNFGQPMTAANQ